MEGPSDNPAVLVVDDDLDILAALHDLLEHQGYRVTCASTCRDALAQITGFRYHAVLLDIGLPDGDGLSVLDILRQQHPLLPVIILTIFGSPDYRARSLSHGAFSCVNKPYDQDALRGLLRLAIQARTSDGPAPPITPPSPSQDS
jgi:two-component system, NtrC family, response regulator PilR